MAGGRKTRAKTKAELDEIKEQLALQEDRFVLVMSGYGVQ